MSNIAIIGGGPAGLICAITAKCNNPKNQITIFEKKDIGATLLPTGGGRCNISHQAIDIKDFSLNYPRGEKFLYSVFSRFFIQETIDFFENIGLKLYTQKDGRIFPATNKSLDVIFALKNEIKRLGIKIINIEINEISQQNEKFIINDIMFEKVVIATGGKANKLLNSLSKMGHNIIKQKPALCSLEIEEKFLSKISGVSLQNIKATAKINNKTRIFQDDILFTHKGISGPLVYKISSLFSRENYSKQNPIEITLDSTNGSPPELQMLFDKNPHKEIINQLNMFMPKSLAKLLLDKINIPADKKSHQITKTEKQNIEKILTALKLHATAPIKGGEVVSSGGIDLKQINPNSMESKIVKNLYFCGEILDIDGFCGGYNLQNCWSTGYIAGISIAL